MAIGTFWVPPCTCLFSLNQLHYPNKVPAQLAETFLHACSPETAGVATSLEHHGWISLRSFVSSLRDTRLQVDSQVPQLHDQMTKENFYILHLFEKKAHLVMEVGVGGGESQVFCRRSGWWRRRTRGLRRRSLWSSWFLKSWIQDGRKQQDLRDLNYYEQEAYTSEVWLGVVVRTCNLSAQEAETKGALQMKGQWTVDQPGVQSKALS